MTEYYGAPRSEPSLAHHGIKGQKWGVRRFQNKDGTLTAAGRKRYETENLTIEENEKGLVVKAISKLSSNVAKESERDLGFTIKDKSGNKVGNLYLYKKSPDELNINWIDIKKSHRGRGYAQEALNTVKKEAAKSGFKKLTLEVPDDDPSALHIYEKMGFKNSGEKIDDLLTPMEMYLKHADSEVSMQYYNELYHHGIKGQKWGVRRFQNRDGSYTSLGERRRRGGSAAGNVYSTARKNAKLELKIAKNKYKQAKAEEKAAKRGKKEAVGSVEDQAARRKKIIKAAVAVGATAAVAGLAIYGSKKLREAAVNDLVRKDIDNAINWRKISKTELDSANGLVKLAKAESENVKLTRNNNRSVYDAMGGPDWAQRVGEANARRMDEAERFRDSANIRNKMAWDAAKRAANRDYKDYEVRSAAKRVVKRQADSVRERARSATAPVRDRVNDISREADQRLRDRRAEQIAYLQRAAGNKSETASDVARRLANKPTSEMFSRSDRLAEAGRVAGERARASVRRTASKAAATARSVTEKARQNARDISGEADRRLRERRAETTAALARAGGNKTATAQEMLLRAASRPSSQMFSPTERFVETAKVVNDRRRRRKKGR